MIFITVNLRTCSHVPAQAAPKTTSNFTTHEPSRAAFAIRLCELENTFTLYRRDWGSRNAIRGELRSRRVTYRCELENMFTRFRLGRQKQTMQTTGGVGGSELPPSTIKRVNMFNCSPMSPTVQGLFCRPTPCETAALKGL